MIGVIISIEVKTLHFVGQMYKSNFFTKDQLTKFEILVDRDKTWDKTLAHFMALFSLRKAYGGNKAANNGFKIAVHIHDLSCTCSAITTSTKKVTSLGTSTSRASRSHSQRRKNTVRWKQLSAQPLPPHWHSIPLLSSKLNSRSNANRYLKLWPRTQNSWQHSPGVVAVAAAAGAAVAVVVAAEVEAAVVAAATMMTTIVPLGKRKNSAQIATRQWSTNLRTASPLRQTRTNVQRDGL